MYPEVVKEISEILKKHFGNGKGEFNVLQSILVLKQSEAILLMTMIDSKVNQLFSEKGNVDDKQ